MAKGGTSGAVSFPDYIQVAHGKWLTSGTVEIDGGWTVEPSALSTNVFDTMDDLLTNNPFDPTTAVLSDPNPTLETAQVEFDEWKDSVESLVPLSEWDAHVDAIVAKLAVAGVITAIAPLDAAAHTDVRGRADSEGAAALAFGSGQVRFANADWDILWDQMKAKVDAYTLTDPQSAYSIMTQALQAANNTMSGILDLVNQYANTPFVNNVVDAYRAQSELERARAVNQFTGQMADGNAVHGSAFVIGMALIQAQHEANVDRFAADLALQNQNSILSQFGNLVLSHLQALNTVEQQTLENNRIRATLTQGALQSILAAYSGRQQFEAMLTQLHGQIFGQVFGENIRGEAINKTQRDSHLMSAYQMLLQGDFNKIQMQGTGVQMQHELARTLVTGNREYEHDLIELDVDYGTWPMKVFEFGSNILGSPSGMGAVLPAKTGRATAALSGALGGAALGTKAGIAIGAAGGPIGAVGGAAIGGLVGGVAGLLQ